MPLFLRPPLWSSGQSSSLQIQRSGFDSRCYKIFWEVVGLERDPLRRKSTTGELLERESSGCGIETEITAIWEPPTDYATPLYPQKLAVNSATSGGRSVGIVRSRTKVTELLLKLFTILTAQYLFERATHAVDSSFSRSNCGNMDTIGQTDEQCISYFLSQTRFSQKCRSENWKSTRRYIYVCGVFSKVEKRRWEKDRPITYLKNIWNQKTIAPPPSFGLK
jgi:hypothetical protein